MSDRRDDIRYELALASRMLANEGVLDAFGHVSLRHPGDPNRFLLCGRVRPNWSSPETFSSSRSMPSPCAHRPNGFFAERSSTAASIRRGLMSWRCAIIMRPRCYPFASPAFRSFPVFHLGAAGGASTPFWNQHDEFGDTNLLVAKPEEGRSLARALGPHVAVLMRHHGATVVGGDLRELVSRSTFMCQNAVYQLQAQLLGRVVPLTPGETKLAGSLNALPNVVGRTWEYWSHRLVEAGRMPPRSAVRKTKSPPRDASAAKGKATRRKRTRS